MHAFLSGFSLGISLILAIGAQNAFVLKQGIKKEHVFVICFVCALSDAILIFAGVSGFGYLVEQFPSLQMFAKYGGFAFLFVYGLKSFYSAWSMSHELKPEGITPPTLFKTILLTLAFTWLNPHVYLDTVILLGSVSTKFGEGAPLFGLGAMTSSFVFFFSLGYGARLLAPLFKKPLAWKILDVLIGIVMLSLAWMLLAF
ncbi:MAG: amino acid transporter [Epsilonproteobacteria bacterium]|nr:amino acid transporter [Campylobacterota bacterium]